MGIFRALLNHLALLVSLAVFQSVIVRHFQKNPVLREVMAGLLFGVIAVLGILNPVHVEGAIYDGRSIILSLAGIFGGPWATLLAAGMAVAARLGVGGPAMWVGIAVIVESAVLGLLYRPLYRRKAGMWQRLPALYAFSLLAHGGMVLLQCALPESIRWSVVHQIWPPVLLLYPPVFVLLSVVFRHQEESSRAQEELETQRHLMQQLLEAIPTPISYRNMEGRYLLCNQAFSHYTGKPREEILGATCHDLNIGEHAYELLRRDEELLANPGLQRFELRLPCADGVIRDVLFERSVVKNADGKIEGIVAVMSDVSEMRRMETQLRQSHKLEAVGRLAGGIAHDFNNMLGVILAQTEEIMEGLPPDSPLMLDLEEVRMAALRSVELTRQLLLFARRQEVLPKRIDPAAAARHSLQMMRRLIPENKAILIETGDGIWPVYIDETHFDQVVTNLLINARDAIEGNGTIRIRVENVVLQEPQAGIPMTLSAGAWVLLRVEDDGCGIAPENLEKIFDPFFTTKDTGKGTGLGLATVYGIVAQASGCIQVESQPGKGTRFDVYFPACLGDSPESAAPERRSTDEVKKEVVQISRKAGHAVLVVEDEEANLRIVLRILGRAGVPVFGASTPGKAKEIFHAHVNEIGLLVTDVIMPEKNGVELWRELRELRPDLRCLFMSGYTADVISREDLHHPGAFFLSKPFDRSAFLHAVHAAMTDPDSGPIPPQKPETH